MNTNPNLKHLTDNLEKSLARISKANVSLLKGNIPAPPSYYFYDAYEALKKLEYELKLIKTYISNSERNHRESFNNASID